jgi:acetoin utilization deacetylase AcuC-like enzyme
VPNLQIDRSDLVLSELANAGLVTRRHVTPPVPATLADLALVHTDEYLDRTLSAETLARIFGVEAPTIDVDCVLEAQRRAVGGTLRAAQWALGEPGRVGFNLGGGFHHATADMGAGFCVYNDVAVAIARLRRDGYTRPIAIVDLDFHQGDGNLLTFAEDASVLTLSVHGSTWTHAEAIADRQLLISGRVDDARYLAAVRNVLDDSLATHAPGLVFYVAGNDVLASDALGSFELSRRGVLERDRMVLKRVRELDASMVVTMAGGYSPEAWRATADFVRFALTGRMYVSRDGRPSFSDIAESLDAFELQKESPLLTEADLMGELMGQPANRRLLDFYSRHGIELALERYGLLDQLRERGFSDLRLNLDLSERDHQRITLHAEKRGRYHRIVDLIVAKKKLRGRPVLSVEWLELTDPTGWFSLRRPRLPGQRFPGLGIARDVTALLLQVCRRLELDGMLLRPSHLHVARMTGGRFVDPRIEGLRRALERALANVDFAEGAHLLDRGCVRSDAGEPLRWVAADYFVPVTAHAEAWFDDDYEAAAEAAEAETLAHGVRLVPHAA